MCNFNCKIRLQTFQMFLTKLKQKYKKIELLKNFCKNQIGFLQSQKKRKNTLKIRYHQGFEDQHLQFQQGILPQQYEA